MSLEAALDRVAKWRSVFAAWQLGTRPADDPECVALKDHRELTLLLRVEVSALAGLLIRKGLVTQQEWGDAVEEEAGLLNAAYEGRFPGMRATPDGIAYELPEALLTMRRMHFQR
jgi:hypothetical protein